MHPLTLRTRRDEMEEKVIYAIGEGHLKTPGTSIEQLTKARQTTSNRYDHDDFLPKIQKFTEALNPATLRNVTCFQR